jgi:hypothetical protein
MDAVDDHHPWYTGESPWGGPIAPAMLFNREPVWHRGWFLSNLHGTLLARQDWELFAPIMVGDTVRSHAVVADRYVRGNREYVGSDTSFYRGDGTIAMRTRTYQSFVIETPPGGAVMTKSAGMAASDEEVEGEPLQALRKHVTPEMCMAFSGPRKNYHNDLDEALAMGFPDVVVAGQMSLCFVGQMLTMNFGRDFFEGGRLSLRYVKVLWGSEAVTATGAIESRLREGASTRVNARIWCAKDDGTRTIVGTASAPIRPA